MTAKEFQGSIEKSIEHWNSKSFSEYKEYLEKTLNLNNQTSIFLYNHLNNFLKKHKKTLGKEAFFFKEKLFYICLELKNFSKTYEILSELFKEFGKDKKIIRMYAENNEITPNKTNSFEQYKQLIIENEEDKESLKRFILFSKNKLKLDNVNDYIEMWNEYIKNYMDDEEAFFELSEIYLLTNNYFKAVFCLEEILLHNPFNYQVLNKIGDIYASIDNNPENFKIALKYYSQSLLVFVGPRSLFGIMHCLSMIFKEEKKLDEKLLNLLKIVRIHIKNLHKNSPFKNIDFDKYYKLPK